MMNVSATAFTATWSFSMWTVVILVQIRFTEETVCLKRDEIEYRDGNVYECLDPNLPACCEIGRSFTCCEEPWITITRNQMWIFLLVFLLALFGLFLCTCCRGQPHVFKAPTAKQAMQTWKENITNRFSRKSTKGRFDLPHHGLPSNGYQ